MNKYEVRRQKLIELKDKYCDGKIAILAEKVDKSPSYVSRLLYEEGKKDKKNIADKVTTDIEHAFNLPRGWLDGLSGEDLIHIPEYRKDSFLIEVLDISASAGPGIVTSEYVETIRSIEYFPEQASLMFGKKPANNIKMISVRGDSMKGTINPGDQVFIDISTNYFDGDGVYIFVFGETLHVKRLQMQKDKLAVLSDNKVYDKWFIDEEDEHKFIVIGKVLLSQTQEFIRHG